MPNGTRKPRIVNKQDIQNHLRCPSLMCPACKHLKPSYGRPRANDAGFMSMNGSCNKCGARWLELYQLCDIYNETETVTLVENPNDNRTV